ncbi:phage portal protein [Aestuariibius insulae]|uniref:phage portal protein n=1 Tax=Aestuariibius insulae TaxID=2058287 RepID=UPI00345ED502
MDLFGMFRRRDAPPSSDAPPPQAMASEGAVFDGLNDPALYEFMRYGAATVTESGASVTTKTALRNTTVLRCVSLIAFAIGMLPLHLRRKDDKTKAQDHPLFRVLYRRPNAWQTAFEFRSLMAQRALIDGNAYALIVRSGNRILQLVPLESKRVQVTQRSDWSLEYRVDRGPQGTVILPQSDVFHVRYGISEDGISGVSLVKQAAEAIGLAQQAQKAAARLFRNGMMVGGALKHPGKLSPEAYDRLRASMNDDTGAENAHRWKILEEGMELASTGASGKDSQSVEQQKLQIEDIARPFGVPRPLLNLDDTSWGSGIDVLGQLFVRYSLNPWFEAWEQAIERSLLSDADADVFEAKFNAGALLRGSMLDQAEFFAKGLGSGGHTPWLHPDEPREMMDMPQRDDLPPAMGQQAGEQQNEP